MLAPLFEQISRHVVFVCGGRGGRGSRARSPARSAGCAVGFPGHRRRRVGQVDVYRARMVRVGSSYVDWAWSSVFSGYKRVQTDIARLVIDIHYMRVGMRVEFFVGQRSRHAPEYGFCNQQRYCFRTDYVQKMPSSNFSLDPTVSMKHHAGPHSSFRNVALACARSVPQSRLLPRACPFADLSDLSFFCPSNFWERHASFSTIPMACHWTCVFHLILPTSLCFHVSKSPLPPKRLPVAMQGCCPF